MGKQGVFLANYLFSFHAQKRYQQRGIRLPEIEKILENANIIKNVGKNHYYHLISQKKLKILKKKNKISASQYEKLKGKVVISCDNIIITVFHKQKRLKFI